MTPANTMAHSYRDNSNGNQTWYATEEFGIADFPSLVKCDDLRSLEVIAAGDPGGLFHWRRDASGGPWTMTRMFAPENGSGAAGFVLDLRPPSPTT